MRATEVVWAESSPRPRAVARRAWTNDVVAVAIMCLILGLEIVAVMQMEGGPAAFRAIAMEGMQQAE